MEVRSALMANASERRNASEGLVARRGMDGWIDFPTVGTLLGMGWCFQCFFFQAAYAGIFNGSQGYQSVVAAIAARMQHLEAAVSDEAQ